MAIAAYAGIKVFSATKARDRERLGDLVTDWIRTNPNRRIIERVVRMSSDREFHCLTIVVFYTE